MIVNIYTHRSRFSSGGLRPSLLDIIQQDNSDVLLVSHKGDAHSRSCFLFNISGMLELGNHMMERYCGEPC